MYTVHVAPDLLLIKPMRATVDIRPGSGMLTAILEGLVRVNEIILLETMLPPLYTSGVKYERECNTEHWLTADQVYARKMGDCEDLACWRAAELRGAGDHAEVIVTQGGSRLYHVRVRRQGGQIEDPSRILGMGNVRG